MTKFSTRLTLSLRCFLHGKPPDELLQTQQTKLVALEQKLVPQQQRHAQLKTRFKENHRRHDLRKQARRSSKAGYAAQLTHRHPHRMAATRLRWRSDLLRPRGNSGVAELG